LIWLPVDLPENVDTIELISGRPSGILATLDSACLQPQGNAEIFVQNVFAANRAHTRLEPLLRSPSKKNRRNSMSAAKSNGFLIHHYAGVVNYDAKDFLAKNMDSAHPDTITLFESSQSAVVQAVLTLVEGGNKAEVMDNKNKGQKFRSTSYVFNDQLQSLMVTLGQTTPYFVRCIKPNPGKTPKNFDDHYVRPQLRCGGLVEALKIIKCGFPTRCSYKRIHDLFGSIMKDFKTLTNLNQRDFTEGLIHECGGEKPERSEYQLGLTMIFFKPGKQAFFQRILDLKPNNISMEQRQAIHKFLIHKRIVRMRGAIRGYIRLRKFCNFLKIRKVAGVVNVMSRTFFKSLRRARKEVAYRHGKAEADRLAKDEKYQAALKAMEENRILQAAQDKLKLQLKGEQEAVKAAQEEAEETRGQLNTMMAKIKDLTQKLTEASQSTKQGKEEVRKLKASVADVEGRARLLTQQLEQGKAAASQKDARIAEIMEELEATKASALAKQAELNGHLDEARSAVDTLEAGLAETTATLKRTEAQRVQLTEELATTSDGAGKQAAALRGDISQRETELAEARTRLAGLEADKAALETRLEEQTRATETATKKGEQQREQAEEAAAQLKKRHAVEVAAFEDKINTAKKARSAIEGELTDLLATVDALDADMRRVGSTAEEDRNSYTATLATKDNELELLTTQRAKALREAEGLRQELADAHNATRTTSTGLKSEMTEMGDRHRQQLEEAEEALRVAKKDLKSQHASQLAALKSDMDAQQNALTKLKEDAAAELTSATTTSDRELAHKDADLTEANDMLETTRLRIAELEASMAALEVERDGLSRALNTAREDAEETRARLTRQLNTAVAEAEASQQREQRLGEDARKLRDSEKASTEEAHREKQALRAELEDAEERATSIEERGRQREADFASQLQLEAEASRTKMAAVEEAGARKLRNLTTEMEEQQAAFIAAELALRSAGTGATQTEVKAWEVERGDMEAKVLALLETEDYLAKELATSKAELRSSQRTAEHSQRLGKDAERVHSLALQDKEEELARAKRNAIKAAEEDQEAAARALETTQQRLRAVEEERDGFSQADGVLRADLARLRGELGTSEREQRIATGQLEARMARESEEHQLALRRAELDFDRLLRTERAKIAEAEEKTLGAVKTVRFELGAELTRAATAERTLRKELAAEKDEGAALRAEAIDHTMELREVGQLYASKTEGFQEQLDALRTALASSQRELRSVTEDREAARDELARERDTFHGRVSLAKMESEDAAFNASLDHERLLAAAEAENRMLRTRVARARSRRNNLFDKEDEFSHSIPEGEEEDNVAGHVSFADLSPAEAVSPLRSVQAKSPMQVIMGRENNRFRKNPNENKADEDDIYVSPSTRGRNSGSGPFTPSNKTMLSPSKVESVYSPSKSQQIGQSNLSSPDSKVFSFDVADRENKTPNRSLR
jgi:chromosome segregation ATPase